MIDFDAMGAISIDLPDPEVQTCFDCKFVHNTISRD